MSANAFCQVFNCRKPVYRWARLSGEGKLLPNIHISVYHNIRMAVHAQVCELHWKVLCTPNLGGEIPLMEWIGKYRQENFSKYSIKPGQRIIGWWEGIKYHRVGI